MSYRSSWMTEELDVFRDQFRKYLTKDLAPHAEKWRSQKLVDRSAWRALGEMGALLPSVPEAYGGLGASPMCQDVTGARAVRLRQDRRDGADVLDLELELFGFGGHNRSSRQTRFRPPW